MNSLNFFLKRSRAFTLAEVLITLGIIGVVAAITIPILMQNYQKQVYLTGLEKSYSQFNNALQQIANDYGCPGDLKCTGLFSAAAAQLDFGEELVKYIKTSKNCKIAGTGCFANNLHQNHDGSGATLSYDHAGTYYRFIALDGAAYYLYSYADNCIGNWSTGITRNMRQVCGYIFIDVNGPNTKPNYEGRDIFRFFITNGKGPLLYPFGGQDYVNYWWKDNVIGQELCTQAHTAGQWCTGKIIEQGWQMNY